MTKIILDCYTDEPAGLGVPPYLGTYPRYLYGYLREKNPDEDIYYLTLDDLRLFKKYSNIVPVPKPSQKTNIRVYNLTKNSPQISQILSEASEMFIIMGVHVPGKYLSALPGTLREVTGLIEDMRIKKILTGPVIFGTQMEGGKHSEKVDTSLFDAVKPFTFPYKELPVYANAGTELLKQIPDLRIIELETASGCISAKCSFCTEPIKSKLIFRENKDVLSEAQHLYKAGARYFRFGKQTCFYSIADPIGLLKGMRKTCKDLKVLHIDNVNPNLVFGKKGEEITKAIVKYCTPGNIAAFGVESFDEEVSRLNKLNCKPKRAFEAIRLINKYGAKRGANGMPLYLPGINILFGLIGETKNTNEQNMLYLKNILKEDLLIRRINIRQVAVFEGTLLQQTVGNKFVKKNKKYYWKWRRQIREQIDWPMLQRVAPKGTILREIRTEIYDGKTTFARQIGTYPLIVGIKGRIPLKQFVTVTVRGHMLRSLVGEVIQDDKRETFK